MTRVESGVAILNPRTGGGKDSFQNSIVPHLELSAQNPDGVRVDIIEPSGMSAITRAIWESGRAFYWFSARNGFISDRYGSVHKGRSRPRDILTTFGSREFIERAKEMGDVVFTMHGLLGQGVERYFAEGDVIAEPSAANSKTTSFVPLEETKKHLESFGDTGEVIINGFIVPQEVKNQNRVDERMEAFATGSPIRLSYLTTGQIWPKHIEYFKKNVLQDMHAQIKHNKVKVAAYLWEGKRQAEDIYESAIAKRLTANISNTFVPNSEYDVQIYYNQNPDFAAQLSFKVGEEADILMTPMGERLPWSFYIPTFAMEAIPGNVKMIANTRWAEQKGIILPFGYESPKQFLARLNTQGVREYYERANEVFCGGEINNGAEKDAEYMIDIVKGKQVV